MRILLVEDDVMLGKATTEGLKTAYAVDWCENAEDAQAALESTPYDLLILDIGLPGKSGFDLLKELRAANDSRPVLFLTAQDSVGRRVEGLNAGADDYLIKPFDLDELIARAGALMRRAQGRTNPEIRWGNIIYDPTARQAYKNKENVRLSGRELAILHVLMENIGRVLSKSQIEDHIYDWDSSEFESNTVEVHISALRKKLGKDFIKTIRGVGYIIPPYTEQHDAPF